jgi:hypothetical protein
MMYLIYTSPYSRPLVHMPRSAPRNPRLSAHQDLLLVFAILEPIPSSMHGVFPAFRTHVLQLHKLPCGALHHYIARKRLVRRTRSFQKVFINCFSKKLLAMCTYLVPSYCASLKAFLRKAEMSYPSPTQCSKNHRRHNLPYLTIANYSPPCYVFFLISTPATLNSLSLMLH